MVNTRHGLGGERVFMTSTFAPVLEAKRPLTDAELQPLLDLIAEAVKDSGIMDKNKNLPVVVNPKAWFARIESDAPRLAAARNRIVGRGTPAEVVNAMPAVQVGLLDELYQFEESRDELMKWYNLPHWQALPGMKSAQEGITRLTGQYALAPLLVYNGFKTKSDETRLSARVALLRVVEAVRLHAKSAGGLPTSLDEIKLPLPLNPFTGKPFTYSVKDGVATLGADGLQEEEQNNRWYELRLRK